MTQEGAGNQVRLPTKDDYLKKRTIARGWIEKTCAKLETAVQQPDRIVLNDLLSEFDLRLSTLDKTQEDYEFEVDLENLAAEIAEASTYRDRCCTSKINGVKALSKLNETLEEEIASNHSSQSSGRENNVKLPKLTLPIFSGLVVEFPSFWEQFEAVIDSSDMPTITKFTYLRSFLSGDAKDSIAGLSLTERNYRVACEVLQKRFGRKQQIIFSHVQGLLNMTPLSKNASVTELRHMQDKLWNHVRSLESLDVTGEQYGVILTPLVLSRLTPDIRLEWARHSEDREDDLVFLLDFVNSEIENKERCSTIKNLYKTEKVQQNDSKIVDNVRSGTATALQAAAGQSRCEFCEKAHPTVRCWNFLKCSISEKKEKMRNKGLCFRCLTKGHMASGCDQPCSLCGGPHHKVICYDAKKESNSVKSVKKTEGSVTQSHTGVATLSAKQSNVDVVMQIMSVDVKGKNGTVKANILLDSGSDRTYVSRGLVQKLDPSFIRSELVSYASFGSGKANGEEMRNVYSLELYGSSQGQALISAIEVPVVCVPLSRKAIPEKLLNSFKRLQFVEDYSEDKTVSVDILVGLDYYWKLVKPESGVTESRDGLVALRTVFGWMLSGAVNGGNKSQISHPLLCIQDSDFRRIWDCDIVSDSEVTEPMLKDFKSNIKFTGDRYEVALPWNSPEKGAKLVDNFDAATLRLRSLTKKFERNPSLEKGYSEAIQEMVTTGVAEEVPPDEVFTDKPVFYLPHRPVVRESSSTTKIRPVFDASAKSHELSLNDCMETGPNLLPNLVEIMIRFRRWPIALVADIKKAFLQIAVRKEDVDYHRFLWEFEGRVRVMRLLRVPFGNKSSPFILNATIKHHLENYEPSRVVNELNTNLYVDDWLTGADSEVEARDMVKEASGIMKDAGMTLTKWGSNRSDVCDSYDLSAFETNESLKILGLKWFPSDDCFAFQGLEVDENLIITKRVVLSLVARLFDPLGLITPFSIFLKCIFQDLWKLGIGWDTEVPAEHRTKVLSWISDLEKLKSYRVSRPYTDRPWRKIASVQLHAFGDASEKAYGACVYLVTKSDDGIQKVSLVLSKARVAPVKRVTLPRLELLGALLASQLVEFVRKALELDKECCFCWTDSMVVLNWIRGDSFRWKPFVANRVSQIQEIVSPSHWSHCKGVENPADLVTRGVSASDLMNSDMWLSGPQMLKDLDKSSKFEFDSDVILDASEVPESVVSVDTVPTLVSVKGDSVKFLETERWSSFPKSIRVVGWILRFVRNLRSSKEDRKFSDLSFDELELAKSSLLKVVQRQEFPEEVKSLETGLPVRKDSPLYKLSPYIDKVGLLRVQGRLDFADLSDEEKHPIIIPKSHLAMVIVRFQHQLLKHAGVKSLMNSLRSSYWILGARSLCKQVRRACVSCRKLDAPPCTQAVAPLPTERVSKSSPFDVTGLDHGGPLFCVDHIGKKFYVLLFTCATTRAVHLELVDSLSAEATMLALRRFVARRGMPKTLMSDNAKGFQMAAELVVKFYGPESPNWKFIAPRAPWWGGWWERLIGLMKSALKRSLGKKSLAFNELETCLHEVEACINSRPLTSSGDDVDSVAALTPSHFLLGRSSWMKVDSPLVDSSVDDQELRSRFKCRQRQLDKFWKIWTEDYLRNLPPFRGIPSPGVKQGALVLIQGEQYNRLTWPLGVVRKVFPGKDNLVRTVEVKTSKGVLVRPIQRLRNLELVDVDELQPVLEVEEGVIPDDQNVTQSKVPDVNQNVTQAKAPEVNVSKSGRLIRKPKRFDE